jgi:hypothetical protein
MNKRLGMTRHEAFYGKIPDVLILGHLVVKSMPMSLTQHVRNWNPSTNLGFSWVLKWKAQGIKY